MGHRIFISVAEDSADVHAASLIRKAAEVLPGCRFHGLTGPRMRAVGAGTVADLTAHAAMLAGTFSVIGRALRAKAAVVRSWRESPPDLVVLLDSPELHLPFARRAKQMGLPVLYYIAPQTWASREGRMARIARDIDRLACILPFEEEYFRERGVRAEYVGHPLFEALKRESADRAVVENLRCGDGPLVALLPGSRRHVVDQVLPLQLDVVRRMRAAGVRVRVAISCVSEERAGQVRGHLEEFPDLTGGHGEMGHRLLAGATPQGNAGATLQEGAGATLVVGDNASLLSAADLVLVASGTATLEVAHYRKPMVVMYNAGPVMGELYRMFGQWAIKTPHLSLVNILAGRRVVPEFMPVVRDTGAVAKVACDLLTDEQWRSLMIEQVDEVVSSLEGSSASERVCGLMAGMLGGSGEGLPERRSP